MYSGIYYLHILLLYAPFRGNIDGTEENQALSSLVSNTQNLEAVEADLDLQLDYVRRNLRIVREDEENHSFAYVTRDDLISVFGNDLAITIPTHDEDAVISKNRVSLAVEKSQ